MFMGKQIMNEVIYLNSSCNFTKPVLMVPETIRTKPLLVYKEIGAFNVGNLGCPVDGNPQ